MFICFALLPPGLFGFDFFDFLGSIAFAAIYTGTLLPGQVPVIDCCYIIRPEGPGPALIRPDRIDAASPLAINGFQEYAVFCAPLFNDGCATADVFEIFLNEMFRLYIEKLS